VGVQPPGLCLFLDRVLEVCSNKPLAITDREQWYPWALGLYGFRHGVEAYRRRVEAWLRLFTLWYNWVRPHQALGRPPRQRGLSSA